MAPSMIQRVGHAFTAAKAAVTGDEAAFFGLLTELFPSGRGPAAPRTQIEVLRLYLRNPLLRMLGSKISQSTASVQWHLETPAKAKGGAARSMIEEIKHTPAGTEREKLLGRLRKGSELREIHDHLFLDLLYDSQGVPGLYGSERRRLLQLYLDVPGETFLGLTVNGLGTPVGMVPLPPFWCKQTPTPKWPFYKFEASGWRPEPVPQELVVWMRDPNPLKPFARGHGLGMSLADEIETHELAGKHMSGEFKNRAIPPFLLMLPGLKQEQAEQMERRMLQKRRGVFRYHLPYFMSLPDDPELVKGIKLQKLAQDLSSLQIPEIRDHQRDLAVSLFSMPPEMVSILAASNRATITAAEHNLAKWVLQPRLEFQREVFQANLLPRYDSKLLVSYKSPVEKDRQHALRSTARHPYSATIDELREDRGDQPLGAEAGGDLVAVPKGVRFVKPEDLANLAPEPEAPASGDT